MRGRRRIGSAAAAALIALFVLSTVALGRPSVTLLETNQQTVPGSTAGSIVREQLAQTCPKSYPTPSFLGFATAFSFNFFKPTEVLALTLRSVGSKAIMEAANLSEKPGKATLFAYCSTNVGKVTQVKKTTTIAGNETAGSAKVKCPQGTHVLYGGYDAETTSDQTKMVVPVSADSTTPRTWTVGAVNNGGQSGELTAIVYCAHVPAAQQVAAHRRVFYQTGGQGLTAKCPQGTQAAYGGFAGFVGAGNDPFVVATSLTRPTGRTMHAVAANLGTTHQGNFQVFAYCR